MDAASPAACSGKRLGGNPLPGKRLLANLRARRFLRTANSAPGRTRTCSRRDRSPLPYPVWPRGRDRFTIPALPQGDLDSWKSRRFEPNGSVKIGGFCRSQQCDGNRQSQGATAGLDGLRLRARRRADRSGRRANVRSDRPHVHASRTREVHGDTSHVAVCRLQLHCPDQRSTNRTQSRPQPPRDRTRRWRIRSSVGGGADRLPAPRHRDSPDVGHWETVRPCQDRRRCPTDFGGVRPAGVHLQHLDGG